MYEITVPKLNSNDAGYVLTEWYFADGDTVPDGAAVAVVETSKAAEELTSPVGGILRRTLAESAECRPGQTIGRLLADDGEFRVTGAEKPAAAADLVITEPARLLIDEHGIDTTALAAIGKKVIGSEDVRRLVERQSAGPRIHRLSRNQLAVAEAVTASHRSIPAAYAVVSVVLDRALDALKKHTGRGRVPELLIQCVAGLVDRYPLFFAAVRDDGTAILAGEARVGVTVDVGRGLSMPVVKGAALSSLATVTETMRAFRGKALRERFTEADLAGATIGVSLPAGDVLLARPLVLPGTSCMLALGATHSVSGVRVAYLGLSYDHRLINGRDAARFLGAVKVALEAPDLG